MGRRLLGRGRAAGPAGADVDEGGLGLEGAVSRRKAVKAAVAGVAGGAVLAEAVASPAVAAQGSVAAVQATTVAPGAEAPAVVVLTDGATIAVDASLGNDFRVTIAGNRAMGNPSSPTDGQLLFSVLRSWFRQSNAPYIEMKQETYVGMVRVGNPLIVPPTIEHVDYIHELTVR